MTSTGIITPTRMIGSGGGGEELAEDQKTCTGGCGQSVANCTCTK